MVTNQANLTETIAQIADEAARMAVQAMAMASAETIKEHRMLDPK